MAGSVNKWGVDPSANYVMTDYYTKASGSDNNIQTDSYINNENTDNIIAPPSKKIRKKIKRSYVIAHFNINVICQ